ncbi:proton-dependent oligopeptide transporter family protein [Tanacetum coccineum]
MQEIFYEQVPTELRSIGLALYLSVMGIGNFLRSFLISIVEKTTGGNGPDGWISDNMNRGHIDYFYYILAAKLLNTPTAIAATFNIGVLIQQGSCALHLHSKLPSYHSDVLAHITRIMRCALLLVNRTLETDCHPFHTDLLRLNSECAGKGCAFASLGYDASSMSQSTCVFRGLLSSTLLGLLSLTSGIILGGGGGGGSVDVVSVVFLAIGKQKLCSTVVFQTAIFPSIEIRLQFEGYNKDTSFTHPLLLEALRVSWVKLLSPGRGSRNFVPKDTFDASRCFLGAKPSPLNEFGQLESHEILVNFQIDPPLGYRQVCERHDKWKCVLTRLIDDLLALDSKVRFDISDRRLELTATFSILTYSEKGYALHHWVHDVVFNVSNQLVILTEYVLTQFLPKSME